MGFSGPGHSLASGHISPFQTCPGPAPQLPVSSLACSGCSSPPQPPPVPPFPGQHHEPTECPAAHTDTFWRASHRAINTEKPRIKFLPLKSAPSRGSHQPIWSPISPSGLPSAHPVSHQPMCLLASQRPPWEILGRILS